MNSNTPIESIRVGNKFHFPFTNEIVEIMGFGQMEYDGLFKVQFIVQGEKNSVVFEPLRTLKPIDLTTDWLINLGFQKHNSKQSNCEVYYMGDWLIRYNLSNKTFGLGSIYTVPTTIRLKDLNYVHEVQNLIYFLIKTDLMYEV